MGKRTNTASWNGKQWRIAVQKDGQRRYFYSSTQGRAGQREANAKADAWLDSGVCAKGGRVVDVGAVWLRSVELSTSADNYRPLESRWCCRSSAQRRLTASPIRICKTCSIWPTLPGRAAKP